MSNLDFILGNFPSFSESKENEQKICLESLETMPVKDSYDAMFDNQEFDKKLLAYFSKN